MGTMPAAKTPVLIEDVRAMMANLPDRLLGVRDRALLLVGFAGGFRRSELVSLNIRDLKFNNDGLTVTLRRSKTDQEASGRKVGLPYGSSLETCPVRSLRAWLEASEIESGPVFRPINRHGQIPPTRLSDRAVALIVKRAAKAAGKDPAEFAGHSLRSGLATAARRCVAQVAARRQRAVLFRGGHAGSGFRIHQPELLSGPGDALVYAGEFDSNSTEMVRRVRRRAAVCCGRAGGRRAGAPVIRVVQHWYEEFRDAERD